jgi:3',5'-cyclic AMP phosphodiesterase CpdA
MRKAAPLVLVALLAGCATGGPGAGPSPAPPRLPRVRFAVIADPHVFDVSRSSTGPALERAMGTGAKMLAESREILAQALADIAAEHPEFLLVCGDLTHDGERSAHELAAGLLREFGAAGIPVVVVPGNHDVRNPRAVRFEGETLVPVAGVEPDEFAAVYAHLGYDEALERDPASLSYVAEPVPGLRVLALDSCWYRGDPGSPRTDGSLPRATRAWAERALVRARTDGAAAIVMLHHAVLPHFEGMERRLDAYLLDGYRSADRMLGRAGARLVFTGHGHAQDIVRGSTPEGPIWDVETGSLVSWPHAWRLVEAGADGTIRIRSRRVTGIPSLEVPLASVSRPRLAEELREEAIAIVERWGVRGPAAAAIAVRAVLAGLAFFAGDEPGPAPPVERGALGPWSSLVEAGTRPLLDALSTDLEPADNDVTLSWY